jgi:hypothetical protein
VEFVAESVTSIAEAKDLFAALPDKVFAPQDEFQVRHEIISLLSSTYQQTYDLVNQFNPHVMFIDSATYAAAAVARVQNRRWATSCVFPEMIPLSNNGSAALEDENLQKSWEPAQSRERFEDVNDPEVTKKLGAAYDSTIQSFLDSLGLTVQTPAIINANLSSDLIILFSSVEVEGNMSMRPNQLRLVGFDHWDSPLVDMYPSIGHPDQYIYITLGTFWSYRSLGAFKTIIAAFRNLHFNAIITTGHSSLTEALTLECPQNVFVHTFVPNSLVLPKCMFVIHHGGFSTSGGALLEGKPSLVLPIDTSDHEMAYKLKHMGVAELLLHNQITVPLLSERIVKMASNEAMQLKASGLASALKQYNPITRSADLLIKLAGE